MTVDGSEWVYLRDSGELCQVIGHAEVWGRGSHRFTSLRGTKCVASDDAASVHSRSRSAAEEHGARLYSELDTAHQERLERERAKLEDSFVARNRAIDRIGLEQVRQHRRAQLKSEYEAARKELAGRENPVPDLAAIQLIRVIPAEAP